MLSEFSNTIRTPIETELVKLEEFTNAVRATFMQPLEQKREEMVTEVIQLHQEKFLPSRRAVESILHRADASDRVSGNQWEELAVQRFDAVENGLNRIFSPVSDNQRILFGRDETVLGLQVFCDDLRKRLSAEADRIAEE